MNTTRSGQPGGRRLPVVESLEDRRFLSAALPVAPVATVGPPVISPTPPVTVSTLVLQGTSINAEANQAFRAVVGTIKGLATLALPPIYSLHGSINWGDGTADTPATFVRKADGSIAVLGGHTYTADGSDDITITVTENPPPGSTALVRLVGTINSTASVITSTGGVTLEEPARLTFAAAVGFFSSSIDVTGLTVTAQINWGDGTTSPGQILAIPSATPVAGMRYEVVGSHTYAQTGSYLVNVVVSAGPTPVPGQPTPDYVVLLANIDSVINALPLLIPVLPSPVL